MVRTLIATMFMSASMAVACPTCGCSDAKTETVSNDAKACATTECTEAAESCCASEGAAAMTVSAPAEAESCSGATCPLTGAAVMSVSAPAEAGECASACETACESACDGEKASGLSFVSYMPKMSYKVGDESMTCSKMAGAMASEHNTHMHYVVAGNEYDAKADAMMAHAKQLEGMMMELVRIQYAVNDECVACPVEAKALAASCESKQLQYKVGPATFESAEDAIAASIMAFNAAKSVNVAYAVGEEMTTCSVQAGDMAKKASCSVEYVVNGQRTNCTKTAGYMKTVASVESALKALETASNSATATDA